MGNFYFDDIPFVDPAYHPDWTYVPTGDVQTRRAGHSSESNDFTTVSYKLDQPLGPAFRKGESICIVQYIYNYKQLASQSYSGQVLGQMKMAYKGALNPPPSGNHIDLGVEPMVRFHTVGKDGAHKEELYNYDYPGGAGVLSGENLDSGRNIHLAGLLDNTLAIYPDEGDLLVIEVGMKCTGNYTGGYFGNWADKFEGAVQLASSGELLPYDETDISANKIPYFTLYPDPIWK